MHLDVSNKSGVSKKTKHKLHLFVPACECQWQSVLCFSVANQEYYHQWSVEESHGCCLDLSSFTIEELDNITSEYTPSKHGMTGQVT